MAFRNAFRLIFLKKPRSFLFESAVFKAAPHRDWSVGLHICRCAAPCFGGRSKNKLIEYILKKLIKQYEQENGGIKIDEE